MPGKAAFLGVQKFQPHKIFNALHFSTEGLQLNGDLQVLRASVLYPPTNILYL